MVSIGSLASGGLCRSGSASEVCLISLWTAAPCAGGRSLLLVRWLGRRCRRRRGVPPVAGTIRVAVGLVEEPAAEVVAACSRPRFHRRTSRLVHHPGDGSSGESTDDARRDLEGDRIVVPRLALREEAGGGHHVHAGAQLALDLLRRVPAPPLAQEQEPEETDEQQREDQVGGAAVAVRREVIHRTI